MTRTSQPTDPTTTRPRTSTLDRAILLRLAAVEYQRFTTMLAGLDSGEWPRPTECPGWDVRAMAGHVVGMAEMAASVREMIRQQGAAKKRGGIPIDALTAVQVEKNAELSSQELIDRFRVVGPRAARARRRTPGLIRRCRMPEQQDVGGAAETWTFGFLIDTILTRDPWLHRIDISRATGQPLDTTKDHDAVLVADVVDEWAARHGRPCSVRLSGLAGGSWVFGDGGPTLELDAIDFCRILSGREPGTGPLSTQVPF
ncbi:MAG: maleylpyruvate isomerase family mycothiol-dependent enzyme [Geodermatophilaceae bacterium]|nr:maleylpyruvate isomerase family mycothiol-dependent enzyme [Geodermatophilaceae bacterium]